MFTKGRLGGHSPFCRGGRGACTGGILLWSLLAPPSTIPCQWVIDIVNYRIYQACLNLKSIEKLHRVCEKGRRKNDFVAKNPKPGGSKGGGGAVFMDLDLDQGGRKDLYL